MNNVQQNQPAFHEECENDVISTGITHAFKDTFSFIIYKAVNVIVRQDYYLT